MDELNKKRGKGRPKNGDILRNPLAYKLIKELLMRDATDREIYTALGLTERTFYRWKKNNLDLWQSVPDWKREADDKVEKSLFEAATGFSRVLTTRDEKTGAVQLQEKYFPPNPSASAFWLKNRRPKDWRDKIDIAASMEQIPVRVNFKRKEKAIETESKVVEETKEIAETKSEEI